MARHQQRLCHLDLSESRNGNGNQWTANLFRETAVITEDSRADRVSFRNACMPLHPIFSARVGYGICAVERDHDTSGKFARC